MKLYKRVLGFCLMASTFLVALTGCGLLGPATEAPADGAEAPGSSWMTMLVWGAVIMAVFYFLMIRPNKKRQEEQKALSDSMQVGSRVMLTSGIFGTIQVMGDRQVVVELSPGMDITVVKQAIAKVLTADDEEFEYADEEAPDDEVSSD